MKAGASDPACRTPPCLPDDVMEGERVGYHAGAENHKNAEMIHDACVYALEKKGLERNLVDALEGCTVVDEHQAQEEEEDAYEEQKELKVVMVNPLRESTPEHSIIIATLI